MDDIDLKMKAFASVEEIDSKKAQQQLEKELSKIMSNLKASLDEESFVKQASKLAKQFSAAFTVHLKDALGNTIKDLTFNRQGKRIYTEPRSLREGARPVRSADMHTVKISPDKSNEGRGQRFSIDPLDEKGLIDGLRKLGASEEVLAKAIDQGIGKILSYVGYSAKDRKWYGTGNINGSEVTFSGNGHLEGGTIVAEDAGLSGLGTRMTDVGQPSAQTSTQATNLLEIEKKLNESLKQQLELTKQLNGSTEKRQEISRRIAESDEKIKQLEKDTNAVFEKGTQSQRKRQEYVNQVKKTKKDIKDSDKELQKLEEQQNTAFADAKKIQQEMNSLIKQNIEFRGKANEQEVVADNEKKLSILEQEYRVKQELLSEDQKAALKRQEENNQLGQQLLLQQKIYKLKATRNTKGTFMDEVETALGRVTTYGVAYNLINMLKNKIKETINIVVKFDKAMTNLTIVTQKTSSEVKKLTQNYVSLAQELGTTSEKVFEAADLWLRQGRSITETNELIRATMIMANVAQIDSAKSADILTSAINGFKLEAKDAMHVVDVFAAVDLAAAANTEELAEAMQRVAATAGEVGVSFENITAYIGTLVDATRLDSGTIGSALNTILSRMQNIKLGNLVGEEETLSDTQKALAQVGVALFDVNGSFRNMDEVLGEIASKWSTLNDVEKSSIAYAVAGMEYLYAGYVLEYIVICSHLRYQKAKMA